MSNPITVRYAKNIHKKQINQLSVHSLFVLNEGELEDLFQVIDSEVSGDSSGETALDPNLVAVYNIITATVDTIYKTTLVIPVKISIEIDYI